MGIARLPPGSAVPGWALSAPWSSVTRTSLELSLVQPWDQMPRTEERSGPWRVLSVGGPLAHDLVGVLQELLDPLAAAGIPVFVISTFDTDHVLVPSARLAAAIAALEGAGHRVLAPEHT